MAKVKITHTNESGDIVSETNKIMSAKQLGSFINKLGNNRTELYSLTQKRLQFLSFSSHDENENYEMNIQSDDLKELEDFVLYFGYTDYMTWTPKSDKLIVKKGVQIKSKKSGKSFWIVNVDHQRTAHLCSADGEIISLFEGEVPVLFEKL